MAENMTYRKARKLNAVFLLLLFATEQTSNRQTNIEESRHENAQGRGRSPEYFEEKLKEFEREKYRF